MNELQLSIFEIPPPIKKVNLAKSRKLVFVVDNVDDELKKTHHNHVQYASTIKNVAKYIQILSKFSFEKLEKNMNLIQAQMELAFSQKNYAVFELLQEWENQHIHARLMKFDEEEG